MHLYRPDVHEELACKIMRTFKFELMSLLSLYT